MIEVKNLTFRYPNAKRNALEDVNIEVKDSAWVSIIGHNGSGKSTLAKILVGLIEAKSGEVAYDGYVLNDKTAKDIRQIVGIVFQNPDNQFVGVTVKHDIAFGLENRMVPREKMLEIVDKSLEKINMTKYKDREPYQLSGGQKQKVAVGGVLACDLKYIIFDEATSMLDPKGSREIVELIKELKTNENKTIITITHDLALANMSDYIYVLKDGKVYAEGKPEDVLYDDKMLAESNLEAPLALKIYHEVMKDEELSKNQKLKDVLCELSSIM